MSAIDEHIGRQVHQRRRQMGITQAELGKAAGVSLQQIHKYETGESRIAAGTLWLLTRALDVPVGYFFEGLTPKSGMQEHRSFAPRVAMEPPLPVSREVSDAAGALSAQCDVSPVPFRSRVPGQSG